jgi:uncharacterized protein
VKVFIDTNVLVSAALRDRVPERVVLFIAMHDGWKWLVTPQILTEYIEVLQRPKFGLTADEVQQWRLLIESRAIAVREPPECKVALRDSKDLPFLAAAMDSAADYLVTGDRDLLSLQVNLPTRILTASAFANEFSIS